MAGAPVVAGLGVRDLRLRPHRLRKRWRTSRPATLVLAREGEMWTLTLGDRSIRLVDSKGLAYLRVLMRDPGREVHVLDLVGIDDKGDAGPVLDAKSKQAYRARAQELREALEEAAGRSLRRNIVPQ